ncbi:TagF domain-containing protein [Sulfitobacter sp. G21635-S1]|uniref:TagF domain-containing protein n=1 Tax=Sulfitobacter sp. G21635-S1 TaxID=3014043 RepID=UPI0022AFE863|nr:TagF domain-containing protein [Sulfitobacter sp. G21635-S1]MCZ4255607.1 TagF domain-containing protein [Sulfitobacter sp. G21635-S1]
MHPETGFFGKLPTAGDFIGRGLRPGVRPVMDRFLTAKLSQHAATPDLWPSEGLRGVIKGPNGDLLLCILPSRDAADRAFPIAACVGLNAAALAEADRWADQVYPVLLNARSADDMVAGLANIQPPEPGAPALASPALWQRGTLPEGPEAVITRLFGA